MFIGFGLSVQSATRVEETVPQEPVTLVFTSNTSVTGDGIIIPNGIKAAAISSGSPSSTIISNILEVTKWENGNMLNQLLYADLQQIPANAQILSASLELTTTTPSANGTDAYTVGVYRLKPPFDPQQVTWVNSDTSPLTAWNQPGAMGVEDIEYAAYATKGIGVQAGVKHTFDITALVQEWVGGVHPNNGILLERQDIFEHQIPNVYVGQSRTFVSPTGQDGDRPTLSITYNV